MKNLSHPVCAFPVEAERGNALPSCFSYHTANKCHPVVEKGACQGASSKLSGEAEHTYPQKSILNGWGRAGPGPALETMQSRSRYPTGGEERSSLQSERDQVEKPVILVDLNQRRANRWESSEDRIKQLFFSTTTEKQWNEFIICQRPTDVTGQRIIVYG